MGPFFVYNDNCRQYVPQGTIFYNGYIFLSILVFLKYFNFFTYTSILELVILVFINNILIILLIK
jgi:hypothetical protein